MSEIDWRDALPAKVERPAGSSVCLRCNADTYEDEPGVWLHERFIGRECITGEIRPVPYGDGYGTCEVCGTVNTACRTIEGQALCQTCGECVA